MPVLLPEGKNASFTLRLFADHIPETYHTLPGKEPSFGAPKSIEYSHLLVCLRSAICMWPYAQPQRSVNSEELKII